MTTPLNLYSNGALTFDPSHIGQFSWPNRADLPALCNRRLTEKLMAIIAGPAYAPYNQILRALYSLPGVLSFNLSFYNLAQSGLPGFVRAVEKPLVTITAHPHADAASLKDKLACYLQKAFLCACLWPLQLSVSAASYYPQDKFGRIFRLRRADAIPRVLRQPISQDAGQAIGNMAQVLIDELLEVGRENSISVDEATKAAWLGYTVTTMRNAWQDYCAYRSFFGRKKFSYYERSLTPYHPALIAAVCMGNGGEVSSTYHGVCQTASEPDVVTMANATTFRAPTLAFADDARDLSSFIPSPLRRYDIEAYGDEDHYRRFVKNDSPRDSIKTIAIIGRHVVMRYSAFNMLEFPFYLDLEKRLGILLADAGYNVIYKAHPESDWRHFETYFDPRVKVDWRPFEKVMHEFDATIFHFGASSVMPHVLGSYQSVFMLQDGWHDIRVWPPRIQKFYAEYATMLPGAIGENGLIDWDDKTILDRISTPRTINPEQRVRDFFCKRYM